MRKREHFDKGYMFGEMEFLEEIEPIFKSGRVGRMMRLRCKCGKVVEKQLKVLRLGARNCGCDKNKPGFPATSKVGDIYKTNEGYEVEIVEYVKASNVKVRFLDEYGAVVKTNIQAVRQGSVANPYHKSVYGVGFYGEIGESWEEAKPHYNKWAGMLERVHVQEAIDKRPTYRDCTIVPEWYCFANFYRWSKEQVGCDQPRWQLDKDILVKGNKEYGPETCCYVPSVINALFTKREACRGELPIGVMRYKTRQGRWSIKAAVCDPDKGRNISGAGGCSPEEAFLWYKEKKEEIIRNQANKYKDVIDQKVYNALYSYQVEITD